MERLGTAVDKYKEASQNEQEMLAKVENEISEIAGSRDISKEEIKKMIREVLTEDNEEPESFNLTSQYTLNCENCYYIPSTKEVHIFVNIYGINSIANGVTLAVVPEKYRPTSTKYGLMADYSSTSTETIATYPFAINSNGIISQTWTSRKLDYCTISIDYVLE